jgi:hypothetical protein
MKASAHELTILKGLIASGGMGNVMEFLNKGAEDFDDCFFLANDMQNKDWVKLLYSNFNKNQIVVEITRVGRSRAS